MVRKRFKDVLLPGQMAADGSFPRELKRTKPYGYSLFNLDAMATICRILSTPEDDLWTFELPDGRVMLNIRNESPKHRRLTSISKDGISNWSPPEFDDALFDPICMASISVPSL